MPDGNEVDLCEGCGLEFDESELDSEGLCPECAAEAAAELEEEDDDASS